jgi:chemotaxis protein MotB
MALAGIVGLISSVGCVPQEDYDQQVMANRKLREELELARIELQDTRSQAEVARARLGTLENELQTKDKLVANLTEERDRHLEAFRRAQAAFEELASRKPQEPVVLTQALPPELDTALREFADKHPESVEFDSKRGIVKWKSDLLFALGSAVVMDSAKDSLREFAEIMNSEAADGFETTIVGHTDNTRIAKPATKQKHPTNWHLSVHRAIAVMEVLRDYSVSESRMGVMGFGELRPLVPNTDEASKAKNRRVEIYVVPRNTIALADSRGPTVQSDQDQTKLFSPEEDTTVEK